MSDAGLKIVYPKAYGPKSENFQQCFNDYRGHYQAVEKLNTQKFIPWQFCYYGYDKKGNEWVQEFKERPNGNVFQRQQDTYTMPDGTKLKRNRVWKMQLPQSNSDYNPRCFETITSQRPDGSIIVKRYINNVEIGGYEFFPKVGAKVMKILQSCAKIKI